jgi:hypothetical protein
MVLARVFAVVAVVAGCGDNVAPTAGDDAADGPYEGGTISMPGCDHTMTTRFGAEAPQIQTPTAGPDPTPFHVHLGLPGDPRTTVAVQWRTRDEVTRSTLVRYAAGDALPSAALTTIRPGVTFAYESLGDEHPRIHETHLCDLVADTVYSYQVGSSFPGQDTWSPVYSFRTAPDVDATPDAEIRLAVVGDTRSGYDVWEQLVDLLAQRQPDLVLFTGDAVTVGIQQDEWEAFFARAEPLFARAPVVVAHGNHELNAVHYYSQLAMPRDEENFGFDYGWAHVTVLNDSPEMTGELESRIRPALAADLAASASARWKLVMHHRAVWSASTNHGSDVAIQRAFMPLYDQYDVDLVLNGHDHNFEITRPLVWDAATSTGLVVASPADGTVFEVQGGAGADLYGNGTGFWTEYSESVHSASMVTVRRDQISLDAFRVDGTPIATGYNETKTW